MRHPQQKYMKRAIQKAYAGIKKGQAPFGSCIVRKGTVVACTHNVVWQKTDITAHAEVYAIRQACKKLKKVDLSDCVIYSTCEPCAMCFSAIHWAKISKIIYGTHIKDAQKIGFSELAITAQKLKKLGRCTVNIVGNFMLKESLEVFREFSQRKGDRVY